MVVAQKGADGEHREQCARLEPVPGNLDASKTPVPVGNSVKCGGGEVEVASLAARATVGDGDHYGLSAVGGSDLPAANGIVVGVPTRISLETIEHGMGRCNDELVVGVRDTASAKASVVVGSLAVLATRTTTSTSTAVVVVVLLRRFGLLGRFGRINRCGFGSRCRGRGRCRSGCGCRCR